MSASPINKLHNEDALQYQLCCPIMLEPLTEAVSLVPCAHKIQQAAAEKIFGTTSGGWLVSSKEPCPICRVPVLGYMVDHSMREIVKQYNEMVTTVKKNIDKESKTVDEEDMMMIDNPSPTNISSSTFPTLQDNPSPTNISSSTFPTLQDNSYPGRRAAFYVWAPPNYDTFGSKNGDSLINLLEVKRLPDGRLEITLSLLLHPFNDIRKVRQYFNNFGIDTNYQKTSECHEITITTSDKDKLEIIYGIITKNNTFYDSESFERFKEILGL